MKKLFFLCLLNCSFAHAMGPLKIPPIEENQNQELEILLKEFHIQSLGLNALNAIFAYHQQPLPEKDHKKLLKKISEYLTKITQEKRAMISELQKTCDQNAIIIKAENYFTKGNFEQAIIYLDALPDNIIALTNLATLYYNNTMFQAANTYATLAKKKYKSQKNHDKDLKIRINNLIKVSETYKKDFQNNEPIVPPFVLLMQKLKTTTKKSSRQRGGSFNHAASSPNLSPSNTSPRISPRALW